MQITSRPPTLESAGRVIRFLLHISFIQITCEFVSLHKPPVPLADIAKPGAMAHFSEHCAIMVETEIAKHPKPLLGLDVSRRNAMHQTRMSPTVLSGIVKAVDFLIITMCAVAAAKLYLTVILKQPEIPRSYILIALCGAIVFVLIFQSGGGYAFKNLSSLQWQCRHAVMAWGGTISILLMAAFVMKVSGTYSRGWALIWAPIVIGLFMLFRVVLRSAIRHWSRQGYLARIIAVVGAGTAAETIIRKLERTDSENVSIVGIFDDRRTRIPSLVQGYEVLGTTDDLVALARTTRIDEVVITLPGYAVERVGALLRKLKRLPVDLRISADYMTEAFPLRGISSIGPVTLLDVFDRPLKHWHGILKWAEDKILGLALLVLAAPMMAVIAIMIRLDSRGPIFFVQDRVGFNNKVIHVIKFRTMYVDNSDPSGAQRTVRNDPRVTRVGRILRQFSLDELPQLINVSRGEMSLIGPRPHAVAMKAGGRLYHEAVSDYMHRHRIKPGLTGWAQVHGLRGEIDTLERARARVEYDLYYIDHWSLWLDLKILIMTIRILSSRQNAY